MRWPAVPLAPCNDALLCCGVTARPPPKYRLFVLVFACVFILICLAAYTSTPALSDALDTKHDKGYGLVCCAHAAASLT